MKKIKVTRNKYVERHEGDVWEESNKTWTNKNGIKRTVTKAGLEEYKESSAENTHVTEKGKIEKWANPDNKIIHEMIDKELEKLEEVVGELKDKINEQKEQPKGE